MRLALSLALIPALALAQTTTNTGLTLQLQGQASQTVTAADCGNTVQVTWTSSVAGVGCADLIIWATSGTCGDSPGASDFQIADIGSGSWMTQATGTETVQVSDLPINGGGADGGTGCGAAVQDTINLCASTKYATYDCAIGAQTLNASPQATVVYDAKPPAVPSITRLDGVDGALNVTTSVPSDATLVSVQYQPEDAGTTWTSAGDVTSESPHLTISGLVNGQTYGVRAFAQDSAGNKSGYSDVVTGQPVETTGFWGAYQGAHGAETGGCTAGGAGGLMMGALALLGLAWRKR